MRRKRSSGAKAESIRPSGDPAIGIGGKCTQFLPDGKRDRPRNGSRVPSDASASSVDNLSTEASLAAFERPALELAPHLLGWRLARRGPDGGRLLGRIVETEAYPGGDDTASHTAGGRRTARNASMWRRGGHLYVYFTYGMHWCANVVSGPEGSGEAVLIRALEPIEGLDAMRARRPGASDRDLCRGPARLCRAFGLDRRFDGAWLGDPQGEIFLLPPPAGDPPVEIGRGPRIGIGRHGPWAERPWRFVDLRSPCRSGKRLGKGS